MTIDVGTKTWMCLICGWIYDEAAGVPRVGYRSRDEMGGNTAQLDLP